MRGIIICIFLFSACKNVPKSKSSIVIVNEVLRTELIKFDELVASKERNIIVASFRTKNDSVIVNLVQSYPDFARGHFQGLFITPKNTTVVFFSENDFNDFFKKKYEMKIPDKLIAQSKQIRNNLELLSVEPKMLSLLFYNGVLIKSAL